MRNLVAVPSGHCYAALALDALLLEDDKRSFGCQDGYGLLEIVLLSACCNF